MFTRRNAKNNTRNDNRSSSEIMRARDNERGIRSFLRENALARYDESPRCIADIMHSVIIVDKWHPLLAGVYGNLKH